jgi:hypothetical protein
VGFLFLGPSSSESFAGRKHRAVTGELRCPRSARRVIPWPEAEFLPRLGAFTAELEEPARVDPRALLLRRSLALHLWLTESGAMRRILLEPIEAALADVLAECDR